MPDGKSDLSGIWQLEAASSCPGCQVGYTPAPALVKERTEQLGKDDPVGLCKPGGAVRILK